MNSKRLKTIQVQHDYYKISRWKKIFKYKNILVFGVYIGLVILLVELAEGKLIRNAYASSHQENQLPSDIRSRELTVREKLTLLYFRQYIKDNQIADAMMRNAIHFNLDPSLLAALMKVESNFKVRAVNYNYNGSVDRGLFQLNSSVFTKFTEEDFFDIDKNISAGAGHLKWCLKNSGNRLAKALALYNAGYGKVENTKVGAVTLDYIQQIMDIKNNIENDLNRYLEDNSDLL